MTSARIRQKLKDVLLTKASEDDRLTNWIAAEINAAVADALTLLREAPTREAVMDHRYWPWKRRAEAFLTEQDG